MGMVATIIETLKQLQVIAKKIENAELSNLIADLSVKIADLKTDLAKKEDENRDLREQLRVREEQTRLHDGVVHRDGLYFLEKPTASRPAGPYCPRCFDVDRRLILLTGQEGAFAQFGDWECPQCEKFFGTRQKAIDAPVVTNPRLR